MAVNPIPEGFHTISPYLMVSDVDEAIAFYKAAFGATEIHRQLNADNKLTGGEMWVGTSPIMLGSSGQTDGEPSMGSDPLLDNLPQVTLYMYVEDVDSFFQRAVDAGAKVLMPVADRFYGNRECGIVDPFGIVWWVASRIEIVPPEEFPVRAREARARATTTSV
jgi:PhnB protein